MHVVSNVPLYVPIFSNYYIECEQQVVYIKFYVNLQDIGVYY